MMEEFVRRKNIENLQDLLQNSDPNPEKRRILLKLLREELAKLPPPERQDGC